jgi:nucleotide-binding universal stress UspA family protein
VDTELHHRVVVGSDGSPAADAALRWALTHAAAHGRAVEVVRAWDLDLGMFLSPVPPGAEDLAASAKNAKAAAEEAVERCRADIGSEVDVRVRAERGRPARVLAAASEGAALLVVGRRGAGAVRQLLGSTSTAALRAARCPVAVVPASEPATGAIVVGWDGSAPSQRAVAWAAEEAAARAAVLEVVVGWQVTTLHSAVPHDLGYVPPLSAYEELAATEAQAGAQIAVELSAGRLAPDGVTAHAVHRAPAAALLQAAEEADLVVVGSRGRGGFSGLVLGSVSDQVSRHARCPVVVVRGATDAVEGPAHSEDDTSTHEVRSR